MRTLFLAVALAAAPVAAVAHEGHSHAKKITGTVAAVQADANRVQVTGTDGKTHDVYVDAKTKYLRGTDKVTLADITAGTRVIAEVEMDGAKAKATVVKVGAAPKVVPK
jgi:hypothetical protein